MRRSIRDTVNYSYPLPTTCQQHIHLNYQQLSPGDLSLTSLLPSQTRHHFYRHLYVVSCFPLEGS